MSITVTPIPKLVDLAVPAFTLGTANAAGAATTAVASDSTLLAFDAIDPAAVAASAVVGSATVSARRDHVHSGFVGAGTVVDDVIARFDGTSGDLIQGYTSGGPTVSDTGVMVKTAQPALLAYNPTTVPNVTGAGTWYPVVFGTSVFDQASNFASPTFTAPVGGRYLVATNVQLEDLTTSADRAILYINTSNRIFRFGLGAPGPVQSAGEWCIPISAIVDMDENDEFVIEVFISGESSDVVDVIGASYPYTFLNVCLLV